MILEATFPKIHVDSLLPRVVGRSRRPRWDCVSVYEHILTLLYIRVHSACAYVSGTRMSACNIMH